MEDGMIYVEKEIKKLILPEIYFKGGKEFFLDPFRKRLIYKTALDFYEKAQAINHNDEGLNDLIKQIHQFLEQN